MTTYFVTADPLAFAEAQSVLSRLAQIAIDGPDIQSLDPREVVRHRLLVARETTPGSFAVEHTALSLPALGSLPGTFSRWFLDELGLAGMAELADRLGDDRAELTQVLGYLGEDGRNRFFGAKLKGRLVQPRGLQATGWDSIFQPDGYDQTLGEMDSSERAGLSLRRMLFGQLAAYLSDNEETA